MTLFSKRGMLLLIYLTTGIFYGKTQNLAVNGNFETYTTLPNYYAQSCYATGWQSPSGGCALVVGQGSPDYYHTLGSSGAKPPTTWWSNVMPHTGNAMQGFAGWYNSSGPYREYVQYHLNAPMIPGTMYEVSYYITNGITTFHGYGCNHIGAYFSATAVTQSGGAPMPYIPQVEDTTIFFSTTWQKKTFQFTPTLPYNYITIGNFYNNINSAITQFVFPSTVVGAYYYIDDVVVQPATPLPVEVLSFTGENNNHINHLHWTTASEINCNYFTIEKSSDGFQFDKIGTVVCHGNSNQLNTYVFDDKGPLTQVTYYRLVEFDYNGDHFNSKIIIIRNKTGNKPYWVYASAETGIFYLHATEYKNEKYDLFNAQGKFVQEIKQNPNFSEMTINLSNQPSGLYLLKVSNQETIENIKIMKR